MAKTIMIQGTMSSVGKSLVTAGLCRIFKQDGYKVAPFKSQNMALNSFITNDGFEMGRAQVMQAEFAGVEPDIRMNPILLKPTGNKTSQVILNGTSIGTMSATDYFGMKKSLVTHVEKSFQSLAKENDIIVIEGAGSPVELNLKENDFVNMGMAKIANSPVILVGDIDRGGIFATLYGTQQLFTEDEKRYLKATLINKFRGDFQLLKPGLSTIEKLTGVPVLGALPYMSLNIDDEDSLTDRFSMKKVGGSDTVDIGIIHLPHISNYTDFIPFEVIENVSIRYISNANEFGEPDLLIIPGSKNTIGDLQWLKNNGLSELIQNFAKKDKPIIGICGGFQMLGKKVNDLHKMETGGEVEGLNLLDIYTNFEPIKTTTRIKGKIGKVNGIFKGLSHLEIEGYEIHMGQTILLDKTKYFSEINEQNREQNREQKQDGCQNGNIYGTYVHGIFDKKEITKEIISALYKIKNIDKEAKTVDIVAHKEKEYDKVAQTIKNNIDLDLIYKILEKGV